MYTKESNSQFSVLPASAAPSDLSNLSDLFSRSELSSISDLELIQLIQQHQQSQWQQYQQQLQQRHHQHQQQQQHQHQHRLPVSVKEAIACLCRRYEGLVRKYARAAHLQTVAGDAESRLWVVLLEAIYAYDPAASVPVPAFFQSRIKFAQWNMFKQWRRQWQHEHFLLPASDDSGGSQDSERLHNSFIAPNDPAAEAVSSLSQSDQRKDLCQALSRLDPVLREVIRRHYGQGESLAAIGRSMGYTKQNLSYFHRRALTQLQRSMADISDQRKPL